MPFSQTAFDILRARYDVSCVQGTYDTVYGDGISQGNIMMELTSIGFERLLSDLFPVEKDVVDIRDIFSITPMEIKPDGNSACVVKYPVGTYDYEFIAASCMELCKALEDEGCKVILMPEIMDVSILTVEQLTQMRDNLTELIDNLSYDNIIGF